MANEKQEISIGHIQTQFSQLTNLLPILADREHPAGQLWSEMQQELYHLTQDLDRQEMLIDQRIEQVITQPKAQELEREQLLAETTALYEGSQAISGALSESQIFKALFQQIRYHDPCEISAYRFHLVDDELLWAELVANWQKQNNPTYPEKTRFYLPDHAQAGLLATREPIFIDDIATDSRLTEAER
ncbi:MAG: hypothetical protein AMJ56_18770, partial [Anaerolineae bacterium SG8_19]